MGDRLVVGLSTDEFNLVKEKKVVITYQHRKEILEAVKYVDKVFPERDWDQKKDDIIREHAQVFAMGDDWAGKFDHLESIVEVVYLPRTRDISTTEIKSVVSNFQNEEIYALKQSLEQSLSTVYKLLN